MRKPWTTKEWREKRAEFIKDKCCFWCGSRKYLTIDHLKPSNSQTDEDYLAFKDAIVLCRRCAFARLKGMHLCQNCKKKYVPNKFDICFDCLPSEKKEAIKAWKEEMSKMEIEVPLVEVTLPCGSKEMVYSDQFEWGGMFETCMHQCPNAKIGGDVNNCDVFLKWHAAMSNDEEKEENKA